MASALEQIKKYTVVVADTGDFNGKFLIDINVILSQFVSQGTSELFITDRRDHRRCLQKTHLLLSFPVRRALGRYLVNDC